MLWISVYDDGWRVFAFERSRVTLGRGVGQDLVLASEQISRHHVTITAEPLSGRVFVQDNGSTNGTRVGDDVIDEPRAVGPADTIRVGPFELRARADAHEPEDVTAEQERAFLDALELDPRDDATRAVYADWLEENGKPARAEYLRAQAVARDAAAGSPAFEDAARRIAERGPEVGTTWRAHVAMAVVRGCAGRAGQGADDGVVSFELECNMRWEDMTPSGDEGVRTCSACKTRVRYCTTTEEAWSQAEEGGCVAIDLPAPRRPDVRAAGTRGRPAPRLPLARRGRGSPELGSPPELRICGTGQRAMQQASAEARFVKALRAHARGSREAGVMLEELALSWEDRWSPSRAVIDALRATIAADDAAFQDAVARLVQEHARVAEDIAANLRENDDQRMWFARAHEHRALIAYVLGDLENAESSYRIAISTLEVMWGKDHLEVGSYLDGYATLLLWRGRTEEAEAAIARARAIVTAKGFTYRVEGDG